MFQKLLKNIPALTIIISIIVFGVIVFFTGLFYNLDRSFGDSYFYNAVSKKIKVSPVVKIIGIDEKTLGELGRFPFDRKDYVQVIENLNNAGVSVIGFDIIFADKSDPESDTAFANAVKEAGNIFLGGSTLKENSKTQSIEMPYSDLLSGGLGLGYFAVEKDPYNDIVYSIKPYSKYEDGKTYPHFSIGILKAYYSQIYQKDFFNFSQEDDNYTYITPDIRAPIYKKSSTSGVELLINYADKNKFKTVSFIDIYNNNFNPQEFKDSIVLIGATAKGIKDVFETPNGQLYGVMTHANVINTILLKNYKVYFNKHLELLLIFFLIILSVYINLSLKGSSLLYGNISMIFIFFVIIHFIVNIGGNALNYMAQFTFALIITLTISNILKSFIEDKNKLKLHQALGEYVSTDIAQEVLHGEGKVSLDGERKELSIFFSDIASFTGLSEKLRPEELVSFLREYLGKMSNIIMDHKGFIDKYEGDAIMALWGVFGHTETSTYDNCCSALDQQRILQAANVIWKDKFGESLQVRMGIHSGEAIIGNIGASGRKMEFTALGDSVNLASRLEGVNKLYGTNICVSQDVFASQKDAFEFRFLDKIRVQGKNIPVEIYELLGKKGDISDLKKDIIKEFNVAMQLYLQGSFGEAITIFNKLGNLGDKPSKSYSIRCTNYINNPPHSSWDGVWNMQTK